ncbi:MAG: DNA-protecting protein DprA, partial [Desulfobulbus sp.]
SGSLITASLALNQGREVFAVPGRVDSVKSEGTHYLLQQGATLVQSVDDVVRELAFGGPEISPGPVLTSGRVPDNLSEKEELLMSLIDVYPIDIDDLRVKSKLQPGTLQNLVLQLELKGLIRQLPGQQYERIS